MRKKIKGNFICILVIILISALIELVCFNFGYLSIPKNSKGLQKIDLKNLELKDMQISGDKIIVNGENPSFKIKENLKIMYLKITPDPESKAFSLNIKKSKDTVYPPKKYNSDSSFKQSSYLRVNNTADNVLFNIIPIDDSKVIDTKSITINSISIDNTFSFNLIRFLSIFLVLFVIFYFVIYKSIVKKKLHITFLIVFVSFGIITALCTPLNFSFDERAHFIKAYEGASLSFGITKRPSNWIEKIDDFMVANGQTSPFDTYKERLEYSKNFSSSNYTKSKYMNTTAATYLPIAYIPASIGIFIGKVLKLPFMSVFYLGRIFAVLGYALVLSFTIKKAKVAKRLIFAIGLLPAVLYTTSSYSADAMTIAFSIATVAVFLNMLASEEKSLNFKVPIIYAICCSIAVMCKMTYAPLCLLILVVPKEKFKDNINKLICKLAAIGIVGVMSLVTIGYSMYSGINQWKPAGVYPKGQVLFILKDIPEYILIMWKFISTNFVYFFIGSIGNFAYLGLSVNIILYGVLIALFVLAIIDNEEDILKFKKFDKPMLALTVAISWILVITALYVTFTPVGSVDIGGVQGRYFTPLVLPFLLLFKNNKIANSFNKEKFNYVLSVSSTLLVVFAALKVFSLYSN